MALQAFALNHVLRQMGHQCTLLSYGRNGPRLTQEEIDELTGDARAVQMEFTRFIKEHIDYSPRLREPDEVRHYLQQGEFDMALCGSDQIWNLCHPSFEPLNMFNFPLPYPKVAYAVGMMDASLGEECSKYPEMSQWLLDFDAISVRENSGQQLVESLTNGSVVPPVVLDPTLLLTREEWIQEVLLPELEQKEYLFCYLFDVTPAQRQLIERVAEENGCRTIVFIDILGRSPVEMDALSHQTVKRASIEMFLSLVRNAKAVVTDSYHGTVFSIIFHRQFFTLENALFGQERLDRLTTLLEKLNLPQRLICLGNEEKAPWAEPIDYAAVDAQLALERKRSLGWLRSAVGR